MKIIILSLNGAEALIDVPDLDVIPEWIQVNGRTAHLTGTNVDGIPIYQEKIGCDDPSPLMN